MTEKQSFILTNYRITLPNIYCIILFITVVAFNKNNVRDIHNFLRPSHPPPDTANNKKTSNKTFSCLICMNYLSHFFITMVLFLCCFVFLLSSTRDRKLARFTLFSLLSSSLCLHFQARILNCVIWNIVLHHRRIFLESFSFHFTSTVHSTAFSRKLC